MSAIEYNPAAPLTNEELHLLSEEEFFEYLDSKAAYLKQFTKPLSPYHVKRSAFASAAEANKDKGTDEIFKDVDYDKIKGIIEENQKEVDATLMAKSLNK